MSTVEEVVSLVKACILKLYESNFSLFEFFILEEMYMTYHYVIIS